MSLRSSLKSLIRRDAERPSLRERAAELRASIPASKPQAEPSAPEPTHADQVAQAGLTGGVLAVSGIDHRDGTVSYADATGKVSRRPMAQWVGFNAMQMHSHVQGEIGRRRVLEANHLPGDEHEAWEARVRRELRADAIAALTLHPERAFKAEQDRRSGAEPMTAQGRAETDAMLLALAPEWEAARDIYAQAIQRQITVSDAAGDRPGPAPAGSGPDWQAWFERCQAWRERTGVEAAEAASAEALDELCEIEDRICELPAASLAGLRLKARVAQRNEDIDWPEKLGDGLIRDLFAFTGPAAVDWHNPPPGFMASPAIEPMNFARIPQGLGIELQRLRDIAWAEYHRRTAGLREGIGEDEARARKAEIRAALFLPALTAAVDLGSVEAQVLTALGRQNGPDPVFALIEEHRAAYAEWDRLSDVWNEMLDSDPEYAEAMAASDEPSRREIAAYEALLAVRPTTLPGVAALAEYLVGAIFRASPDIRPSDGERGLTVIADALRTVLATREERSRREASLVGMLDFASASLDDLQAIRGVADAVGGVAYAYTWGPRCGTRTGRYGATEPNELGKLIHWLGDALTEIESAAELEASRRVPSTCADRETRLSMCAVTTIDSGDPAAIEAFAHELVAHAEAERAGR
ncbi:hypothetical protein MKL09_31370 [Methylobacterium sp. J-048]|uniref:hypothetical protein n=1 Tax=Methylobacterium sp. J-048 TaxID=2836635 RepID=UPI001FB999D1|nr:hypothetical protein [Methylobacterium sp. J-048]MCJ2061007.1 hypothetical protein [Methylobacterium sp. J-048]